MGTVIPIVIFSIVAVITSESASMEETTSLPNANDTQKVAARFVFVKSDYFIIISKLVLID
jgi:hypothetical protein